MIYPEEKKKIIAAHQINPKDTGSPQVQIAILNEEVKKLSIHLKNNLKDIVSRRVLLFKVAQRKRLQRYLLRKSQ